MMPPLWFLDYFVMNGFADCKVYIIVAPFETEAEAANSDAASDNVFTIDPLALFDPARGVAAFAGPKMMMMTTIVFAEKGKNSTSNVMPSQQHYRDASEWEIYRKNLGQMMHSARPHLVRSSANIHFFEVRGGHLFIARDFTARDPWTEIQQSYSPVARQTLQDAGYNIQELRRTLLREQDRRLAAEAEVKAIRASRSWRVTAPFRRFKHMLDRLGA